MRSPAGPSPPFGGRTALVCVTALLVGGVALLGCAQGVAAPPPANDALAAAQAVGGLACDGTPCEATVSGSTVGATVEDGEDALELCSAGATVWYRLDVTDATLLTLTLQSDFGATLAVATGDAPSFDGLSGAASFCGDGQPWEAPAVGDPPNAQMVAVTNGTWWIQVGGALTETGAQTGSFSLRITLGMAFGVLPDAPTLRVNEKGPFTVDVRGRTDIGTVDWDFGDGSTGEGYSVRHRWTATGGYTVNATGVPSGGLVLVDGQDAAPAGPQAETQVTVVRAALTPRFDVEPILLLREVDSIAVLQPGALAPLADPIRVPVGMNLQFTEQAFGGSGPLTFAWSFGDGATDGNGTAVHAYSTIGAFPAKLTVRDGSGHMASLTRTIHVYDEVPFSGHAEPGGNVTLDAAGYASIVCEVGANGTAADFDGLVTVATDAAGLGDAAGALPAARGVLFVSIEGGPQSGQCDRVTLTLRYTDAEVKAAGATETRLRTFYWNGAQWLLAKGPADLPGATPDGDLHVFSSAVDLAGNEAVVVTNHTSTYAVGSPAGGGGGGGGSAPPASAPPAAADPAPAPAPAADAGSGPAADGSSDGAPAAGEGAAAAAAGDAGEGSGLAPTSHEAPALGVRRPDGAPLASASRLGGTLDGVVDVVASHAPATGVRFVLDGPDGETELGRDADHALWDTQATPNGRYQVVLRDDDGTTLASTSYLVYNGRADALQATGAVLVGAGIMGTGFLLSALLNVVREGATAVGEDKFRERTKRHRVTAWLARVPSLPSLLIGVPVFVVFFALDGMPRFDWAGYLARLPVVAAAAAAVFAAAYSLEILLNVASGARSRFQLLLTGFLALATSTLLFRTAFGYPGFVEEEEVEGGLPRRVEGLRSVALLLVILFLAAPFFLLLAYGPYALGETGMAITMSLLATSSLPFRPVPGANIWRWSKALSLTLVAATFGLLVAFETGAVPLGGIALAGVGGLAGFAAVYAWLRRRPEAHGGSGHGSAPETHETHATGAGPSA